MKHEDFTSLEIDDVLTKVLGYCQSKTAAAAVHWLSASGLARVREAAGEEFHSGLATADVVGQHMWSQPASDLNQIYQMWRQVEPLFPQPYKAGMSGHQLSQPHWRYVHPVCFGDRLIGLIMIDRPKEMNPVALLNQFKAGLDVAAKYMAFAYDHLEAKDESYRDELTGLYNQRFLPMALDHEISRAKRDKGEFTLLFLDIDYFKMVNDGRGHWVGSRLLVELGKVLRSQVRSCDYCFRYGGDEFIVMLGGTGVENSKIVAERIRKAVEQRSFTVEGHTLNLTVSIGLASYPTHAQTAVDLIQIADQAMYYGKRKSRNIVFVAS